jgi:transcriptional regulator with XRE-family HTH domain
VTTTVAGPKQDRAFTALENFTFLRESGESIEQAAARMGITERHATRLEAQRMFRLAAPKVAYRDAREAAGLTLAEAARELGVKSSTLHEWEKKNRCGVLARIQAMATMYRVPVRDLTPRPPSELQEREPLDAEDRGKLADRLADMALELAFVVRTEGRTEIARAVAAMHLAPWEKDAMLVVMAGLIPISQTKDQLLGWVTFDEHGRTLPGATPQIPEIPTRLRAA